MMRTRFILAFWVFLLQNPISAANYRTDQGLGLYGGFWQPTGLWGDNFDGNPFYGSSFSVPAPYYITGDLMPVFLLDVNYFKAGFKGYPNSTLSNISALGGLRLQYWSSDLFNPYLGALFGLSYSMLSLQAELTLSGTSITQSTLKPSYALHLGNEFLLNDYLGLHTYGFFQSTLLQNEQLNGYGASIRLDYKTNLLGFDNLVSKRDSSIVVKRIEIPDIFPVQMHSYNKTGFGEVEILTRDNIKDLYITVEIPGAPGIVEKTLLAENLQAGEKKSFKLPYIFRRNILEQDEVSKTEVKLQFLYSRENVIEEYRHNEVTQIYPRSAMIWEAQGQVAHYIQASNLDIMTFSKKLLEHEELTQELSLNKNSRLALLTFNILSSLNIQYLQDPAELQFMENQSLKQLDSILFPNETLNARSGDCEDLVILYASLLESNGIETMLAILPDHIFLLFNSGLKEAQRDSIDPKANRTYVLNGYLWIPIEVTAIDQSFTQAWKLGAGELLKHQSTANLELIKTRVAWESYPPFKVAGLNFSSISPVEIPKRDLIERISTDKEYLVKENIRQ